MPSASDDVVIDEAYIKTEGNGYLVDGFWNSDTTWNSLTLNYDSIYPKPKKLNSNAGGPITITITKPAPALPNLLWEPPIRFLI